MSKNDRLKEFLIDAGVSGRTQQEIIIEFKNHLRSADLVKVLNQWHKLNAVQKFRVEAGPYRPITVWRATTKLLEIEDEI